MLQNFLHPLMIVLQMQLKFLRILYFGTFKYYGYSLLGTHTVITINRGKNKKILSRTYFRGLTNNSHLFLEKFL